MQAVSGLPSPRTLRFLAIIQGHSVSLLVDTGSSHNIIQPRVAMFLDPLYKHLPHSQLWLAVVHTYIALGSSDVYITVQQHTFNISLYLLPIHGADVVLGVQWLQTLAPFVFDYIVPSMKFYNEGSLITLTGDASPSLSLATLPQLNRMIQNYSIVILHTITMIISHNQSTPNDPPITDLPTLESYPPDPAYLLLQYSSIFSTPHGLPPNWPHNSSPINIKQYHYLHFQNEAMTTMIAKMLQEWIIRSSTSPFSSPVLLVKKKDGSWRFCVDYRALTAITIKDRFIIPTIDELFDELNGASYFSKIDLQSRYHQIRLAQPGFGRLMVIMSS